MYGGVKITFLTLTFSAYLLYGYEETNPYPCHGLNPCYPADNQSLTDWAVLAHCRINVS